MCGKQKQVLDGNRPTAGLMSLMMFHCPLYEEARDAQCPSYMVIYFGWMVMKHLSCASGRTALL